MTAKNQYWQVVRAICILAVVMIHCPTPTNDINAWLIIRQFINFPVAVFIFLSGYFVNPDKVNIKWVKIRGGALIATLFNLEHCVYSHRNR